MTKYIVRIATVAMLEIDEGMRFLDIGVGTGSISVQAALAGAQVSAVECNAHGILLCTENAKQFGVTVDLIEGMAPEVLPESSWDRIFIGGSRGNLPEIMDYCEKHLVSEGMIVANFIKLDNLDEFRRQLSKRAFKAIEVRMVQDAHMDHLGLMKGENPIFIVKAVKE